MRLSHPIQFSLRIYTALAFYPFMPEWLQEKNGIDASARSVVGRDEREAAPAGIDQTSKRAAREASRLCRIYGSRATRSAGSLGEIVARDDKGLSAPIAQDGRDVFYWVNMKVGSKQKELSMLIDTGAGSSWVMSSSCETCSKHRTLGPDDSTSLEEGAKPFSVSYGTGNVTGKLSTDTVAIGGVSFKYQFGVASQVTSDIAGFSFDGILGLSLSQGVNDNFLRTFTDSTKPPKNLFCIALSRAADGSSTSEITFGSINQDKYVGDIGYTPVSSKMGEWAIKIDDISYDGSKSQTGGVDSYIDSGTSLIFGPKDKVEKLHSLIPGAANSDGQAYTVPCDTAKPLTFTFSGVDYTVPAKSWISPKDSSGKCTSSIFGREVVPGAWLLGDTFLKNFYSVFDNDAKRIGFANLASSGSTTSASSTSTTATQASTTATDGVKSSSATTTGTSSGSQSMNPSTSTSPVADGATSSGTPEGGVGGHETHTSGAAAASTSEIAKADAKSKASGKCQSFLRHQLGIVLLAAIVPLVTMS